MSTFLSWFVIIITLGSIFGCYWLIKWASKRRVDEAAEGDVTGHTWDGDLQEYNNPLPAWWLWMFYITIIFGLIYLVLYPGLGNFQGVRNWTSVGQYQQERERAEAVYGPIFAAYAQTSIPQLAQDHKAMQAGQRLFLNYCATCHGSDAGGARGFPSLKDGYWSWGGTPEAITASIMHGRIGVMPPHAHLGDEGIEQVASYVMQLSGREADAEKARAGKAIFEQSCTVCHGPDGKGQIVLGAPDLTNNLWVHGGSPGEIRHSIREGRTGQMPAHGDFLGSDKVHLLAAYVYGLAAD
jgi:cytochrome c oxidase cbb3-type subunit 3